MDLFRGWTSQYGAGRFQDVIVRIILEQHIKKSEARALYDDVTPKPTAPPPSAPPLVPSTPLVRSKCSKAATAFGNACAQYGRIYGPGANNRYDETIGTTLLQAVGSEDCLYLNVWRPATEATDLPVIVFFHGGGFVLGDQFVGARGLAHDGLAVGQREPHQRAGPRSRPDVHHDQGSSPAPARRPAS